MSPSTCQAASMPCPKGHALEDKNVKGTRWFGACKTCSNCRAELKTGMSRHSCKACKYHLCATCHPVAVEDWLKVDITVTIYREAQPGLEDDTWPVCIERGANIGSLKNKIFALYGLAPQMQAVLRDIDSTPLADDARLECDEGDVLHLKVAAPGNFMMGSPLGMPPMAGLAEAISSAMNEVTAYSQAMQESLESTSYNLTFVMSAATASGPERRCRLEIAAVARAEEVLDMVKLELNAEDVITGLEFAGQELPLHAPIHALGLRDGDLLMVLQRAEESTSL